MFKYAPPLDVDEGDKLLRLLFDTLGKFTMSNVFNAGENCSHGTLKLSYTKGIIESVFLNANG